jgi:hypothetical protein
MFRAPDGIRHNPPAGECGTTAAKCVLADHKT